MTSLNEQAINLAPAHRGLSWVGGFLQSGWALVLAVALAFILNSYSLPLSDVDEGAFSEATREMLARDNLVSPTLNGVPRHDKPILIYWAQIASVSLIGPQEIGFRLPSILAAILWLIAIYRFAGRHGDSRSAQVAALVMVLSLLVGVIAKAAIADALLNLCLCMALFAIYDYFRAQGTAVPANKPGSALAILYLFLGLGFLAKGPVAVMFPVLIGTIFFFLQGASRAWLRAICWMPGWGIFLAIVLPWHGLVYLDQGEAFFRGFYLQHNLNRYTSTFEGHGGNPLYYLLILPFIMLPFSGWLMAVVRPILQRAKQRMDDADSQLELFLLLWFVVVLAFFSFSRTQLPHYLLYGATPLFLLLARYRLSHEHRLLAFAPVLLVGLLLMFVPQMLAVASTELSKPYALLMVGSLSEHFPLASSLVFALFFGLTVGLYLWRRLPVWQGLIIAGFLQAALMSGFVLPRVLAVSQEPVRQAALLAREWGGEVVAYRLNQPSFSVYRQAITPSRVPKIGEVALLRVDRLEDLRAAIAPNGLQVLHRDGFIMMARVLEGEGQ